MQHDLFVLRFGVGTYRHYNRGAAEIAEQTQRVFSTIKISLRLLSDLCGSAVKSSIQLSSQPLLEPLSYTQTVSLTSRSYSESQVCRKKT